MFHQALSFSALHGEHLSLLNLHTRLKLHMSTSAFALTPASQGNQLCPTT